jgi:DNA ligase-1
LNPESFQEFSNTLERVSETGSKLEKIRILSEYFSKLSPSSLSSACRFILGKESAKGDVGVGWSTIIKALRELRGVDAEEFRRLYLELGDSGSVIERMYSGRGRPSLLESVPPSLEDVQFTFDKMAEVTGARSSEAKKKLLMGLYARMDGRQAKYLTRILSGEVRIGATEGLVLDALGKAFGNKNVRDWYLIVGDIGEVARKLASGDRSNPIPLYFRPVAFMLALPIQTPKDVEEHFHDRFYAEYKYDGVRLQAHVVKSEVRLFSRRMEDVTRSMPELVSSLKMLSKDAILDGEALGFKEGKPMSFMQLQRRLHRKEPDKKLIDDVPIHYFVFDLLKLGEESMLDVKLFDRRKMLDELEFFDNVRRASSWIVDSADDVDRLFRRSRQEGYEGLVLKDPHSPYTPGRRGGAWVKLKEELDTLDVVVIKAEYGNGKRAGVLSDLTFAVWDNGELKTIGKAYSGLTDEEIASMTETLKNISVAETWNGVIVRPSIVIEVAFDSVQRSSRHDSGYALRFPRIKRIREDKKPEDADTLERVRSIYEAQLVRR